MKGVGYRECAAGPHGQGTVPLDRNPRKLPVCREDWNGKVAGSEGFPKSSMEVELHAGSLSHVISERVKNGPIVRAQIGSDEVPYAAVPWPMACGDGRVGGHPG
jgi:hypothetical protein